MAALEICFFSFYCQLFWTVLVWFLKLFLEKMGFFLFVCWLVLCLYVWFVKFLLHYLSTQLSSFKEKYEIPSPSLQVEYSLHKYPGICNSDFGFTYWPDWTSYSDQQEVKSVAASWYLSKYVLCSGYGHASAVHSVEHSF